MWMYEFIFQKRQAVLDEERKKKEKEEEEAKAKVIFCTHIHLLFEYKNQENG